MTSLFYIRMHLVNFNVFSCFVLFFFLLFSSLLLVVVVVYHA